MPFEACLLFFVNFPKHAYPQLTSQSVCGSILLQMKMICIFSTLRAGGKGMERLTKNRERVREVLFSSEHPLTAYDISKECPEMSLTTIYRALDYLVRKGQVKSFTFNQYTYFLPSERHEDFFLCTSCGKFFQLECLAGSYEQNLRERGMIPSDHLILITGLCNECNEKLRVRI